MNTIDFMTQLRKAGIKLWVEDGKLRFDAPKGSMTPDLKNELVQRKAEIIHFLSSRSSDTQEIPSIWRIPRDRKLPLSFNQESLWLIDQMHPGSSVYNITWAYQLKGKLNIDALNRSLKTIIQRHEILRTVIRSDRGVPYQEILPLDNYEIPIVQLSSYNDLERNSILKERILKECDRPFNLAEGPLFRGCLFQLSDQDFFLLFTAHHTIHDEWSLPVFENELTLLYGALTREEQPILPDLPVQYADFANWQKEAFHRGVFNNQLDYWKKQLANIPSALDFPTDHPRPAYQTFNGASEYFDLNPDLSDKISELCRRLNVTPFIFLLAVFKILIHRYTGQEDLMVGSPMTNRGKPELNNLIGYFVNSLVFRTQLSGDMSFRTALNQVREVVLAAFDHAEIPFDKVVAEVQADRDPSRNPLFQLAFVYTDYHAPWEVSGVKFSPSKLESHTSHFDLTLFMVRENDHLSGSIEFNTDLFERSTIQRMIGHYQSLLEGIVKNPEESIATLPLLTETERHQILVEWNQTYAEFPKEKCVHQLVEEQVNRTPDLIAVCDSNQKLTYRELNRKANQIARILNNLKVEPESLVGVLMDRSVEMVTSILGILKAGGAYLPLDPEYPVSRLAYMLEDSGCKVLLSKSTFEVNLTNQSLHVVHIDKECPPPSSVDDRNPELKTTPRNLAYVIYTSGSTGRPKGVPIEHIGLVNLVYWHKNTYSLKPGDRATQVASFSFDAAVWEIWPYLVCGGEIHLISDQVRAVPTSLLEELVDKQISICFLPTPMAEEILRLPLPKELTLRALLTGGDKIQHTPEKKLPFQLVNHYGPTENTVVSTFAPVLEGPGTTSPPPIGRPISNTMAYILDGKLQPVPVGVPGELHVGGVGLTRGYLNRPELTVEKFIRNPFSDDPKERIYKTGDLVRYLPDGNIEFLGRIDHQVKIRGFRIELGEIENVLNEIPGVTKAIVLAREDVPGDKRLVAYLTSEGGNPVNPSDLRTHLKERLPEYMVPSAFVVLDTFPLTPNGKIDRKGLPIPETSDTDVGKNYVAPRNEVEKGLAQIWADILGIKQVGIQDNFFEIGGHSLATLRVIAAIKNQFSVSLPPVSVFENPTIEELARLIRPETEPEHRPEQVISTSTAKSVDLAPLKEKLRLIKAAKGQPGRFRMRESAIAKYVLKPLYRIPKRRIRLLLQWFIAALEGGEFFSLTLRKIYKEYFDIEIGAYSYGCFDYYRFRPGSRIGRYTIIAKNVRAIQANHPSNTLSTLGFFYEPKYGISTRKPQDIFKHITPMIGNDVYIGPDALILSPTSSIGDGAIIGTRSVVSGDVPPYAVVTGYPAMITRYRFSKPVIEELLKSKWWEKDLDDLATLGDMLSEPLEGNTVH